VVDAIALFAPFLDLMWPKEDDASGDSTTVRGLPPVLAEAAGATLGAADLGDLQELLSLAAAEPLDIYAASVSTPRDVSTLASLHAIVPVLTGQASVWPPQAAAYIGEANLSLADQGVRNLLILAFQMSLLARVLPQILAAVRFREGIPEPKKLDREPDWSVVERFPYSEAPLVFRQLVVDARRAIVANLALHHAVQTETKLAPWLARGLAEVASDEPRRLMASLNGLAGRADVAAWAAELRPKREAATREVDAQFVAAEASGSAVYDPFAKQ
jgi:hypothetical protein